MEKVKRNEEKSGIIKVSNYIPEDNTKGIKENPGITYAVIAYKIYSEPDLINGERDRLFNGYLLVTTDKRHEKFVEAWCYKKYGNRYDFIHGYYSSSNIIENWIYEECPLSEVDMMNVLDRLVDEEISRNI